MNKTRHLQLSRSWGGRLTAGALVCALLQGSALGAPIRFSPDWSAGAEQVAPNQSFLDNLSTGPAGAWDPEAILDAQSTEKIRLQYETMTRTQRLREDYSLTTPMEERSHMSRMGDFTRHVLRTIFQYHVQDRVKRAERNSAEVRTFRTVSQSMEKMTVKVDEGIEFGTRTDIPNQKGTLWARSPYLDASFDMNLGSAWADPLQQNPDKVDPRSANNERFRIAVSRRLPVLALRAGVTYGIDSTLLTASLSRRLTPNLTAEVLNRQGLNQSRSGLTGAEQAVKMNYGIAF
ncbi:MAG: hypothetical protein IT285_08465 [Bdellovibrionales bacterium]|nr:hypothetical protein [Bdellovibrionales bacterium]